MFLIVQLGITRGGWFLSCWASLLNYRWLQITTTWLWCRKWKCLNMLSITQLVMTLPSCCGWKVQAQRWVQHVYWLVFGNQCNGELPSLQNEWEVAFVHHKLRWATAECEGMHTCPLTRGFTGLRSQWLPECSAKPRTGDRSSKYCVCREKSRSLRMSFLNGLSI